MNGLRHTLVNLERKMEIIMTAIADLAANQAVLLAAVNVAVTDIQTLHGQVAASAADTAAVEAAAAEAKTMADTLTAAHVALTPAA